MKIFCFVAFIVSALTAFSGFTFTDHKPDRYILIEHVGITDKIIPALAIAEGKTRFPVTSAYMPDYLYYKFVLNSVLYSKSEVIVANAKGTKELTEEEISDFGCFKISIVNGNKKIVFFIARREAFNLFSHLREFYLKEKVNPDLPSTLNQLSGRISF